MNGFKFVATWAGGEVLVPVFGPRDQPSTWHPHLPSTRSIWEPDPEGLGNNPGTSLLIRNK